jgi:hypothetical protein
VRLLHLSSHSRKLSSSPTRHGKVENEMGVCAGKEFDQYAQSNEEPPITVASIYSYNMAPLQDGELLAAAAKRNWEVVETMALGGTSVFS